MRTVVRKLRGPAAPEFDGAFDGVIIDRRENGRRVIVEAEGECARLAFFQSHASRCGAVVDLERRIAAKVENARAPSAVNRVAALLQPRSDAGVIGTRGVHDFDRHFAVDHFDAAQQLAERRKRYPLLLLRHDRHQIEQTRGSGAAGEGRLDDVGSVEIASLRIMLDAGMDGEEAAFVDIEKTPEYRRRIEARPAQPVDRSAARDERHGTRATDGGVVGNGNRFGHSMQLWRKR